MVENAKDVSGETKPNFVEISGDVKPPKVEAKPNIDGASIQVEASKYVDSVSSHFMPTKLTRLGFFFQTTLSGKIEKNCLSGHVVKQIRRYLQLFHKDQA